VIERLLRARRDLRFALWAAGLRLRLRRHGGRLVLDAPHGARLRSPPHVEVDLAGGAPHLTLRLGRDVSLGRALVLEVGGRCELAVGDAAWFGHAPRVQLRGGRVTVGARSHVRDGSVLKSDGDLAIGEDVTVGYHDVLACTERIVVGDRSGLGERVTITDSDHTPDGSDRWYLREPLRTTPVVIGRNVLVSANAVVLRGAHVGDNAVVAAGAVLRGGEHPGGWLHAGAPALAVRALA
jgi:carbonic anhydrase/acetyltransferase-like protein (isoleucine patch superfamily)